MTIYSSFTSNFRCVVWTGDGRVFFYNPSSRTSVWERPEDLLGRSDVDKMVAAPPDAASAGNKDAANAATPATTAVVATNKTTQKTKRAGSDDSDSDEGGETPAKKTKKDESGKYLKLIYFIW